MKKTAFEIHWEDRLRIDDPAWQRILSALPLNAYKKSGPAQTRDFVEAVLWIAMAHAPWSRIPVGSVSPHSTMVRFHRWLETDLWDRVVPTLDRMPDASAALQTFIRRHLSRKRMSMTDRSAKSVPALQVPVVAMAFAPATIAPHAAGSAEKDGWPMDHWPEAFGP